MIPPAGTKTKQGYELQLGTNCVAPFLFTKLLTPLLIQTAKTAPKDSVRVVWTASNAAEIFSPKNGVDMENLDYKTDQGAWHKYGVSKAGNVMHASEFARRYGGQGIVSVVSILFHWLNDGLKIGIWSSWGEEHCVLMAGVCNRASIPAGSRRICSGTCRGGR